MKLRRLTALVLVCCLLLAGCGAAGDPVLTTPVEEDAAVPVEPEQIADTAADDTEAYGLAYSPSDGWNPYTCLSQENRTIFPLLYEGLFEVSPEFTATPVLCESSEMSLDEKTWKFVLRSGACFSDGSAITSSDIVASYELAGASDYYESRFAHISSITATDVRTVTITLDTACGDLPLLLDIPIIKAGTGSRLHPTGSGAYVLATAPLCLEPSDAWWQEKERPFGDAAVTLVAVSDSSEVRDSFELREISLVCTDPTAGTAYVYHSDYELWTCPTTVMVYLGFNCSEGVFADMQLRAGVTWLIDRETLLTEDFAGFGTVATLPASARYAGYDRSLAARYDYDPSAFTAEIPADSTVRLIVNAGDSSRVAAAQDIAEALREAGFAVEVSALAASAYTAALKNGEFDCYLGEIRLTADFSLEEFFKTYGSASYGIGGHKEALDAAMKMLENIGNAYDLHELVMEEGLICPILFQDYAVYCARGAFSGLTAAPYNVFYRAVTEAEE